MLVNMKCERAKNFKEMKNNILLSCHVSAINKLPFIIFEES